MEVGTEFGLKYSDGIAAARTMIALEGNATALRLGIGPVRGRRSPRNVDPRCKYACPFP